MARSIFIQFGELPAIPMNLENAVETKRSLSTLCDGQPGHEAHNPAPIKMPRTCTECGPIVDVTALKKGIKRGKEYALVTQEENAEAKEAYAGDYRERLNLVAHPAERFLAETGPGDKLYYLTPGSEVQAGQYQTLRKFIQDHSDLAFVGLYTPVSATAMFRLTTRGNVLVMEKRERTQNIKPIPSVGGDTMEKLGMFMELTLEDLTSDYDPTAYEDRYEMALEGMAADNSRLVQTLAEVTPLRTGGMSDMDLMEKLAGLEAAAKKKPVKKAAAKRAPRTRKTTEKVPA